VSYGLEADLVCSGQVVSALVADERQSRKFRIGELRQALQNDLNSNLGREKIGYASYACGGNQYAATYGHAIYKTVDKLDFGFRQEVRPKSARLSAISERAPCLFPTGQISVIGDPHPMYVIRFFQADGSKRGCPQPLCIEQRRKTECLKV